VQLNGTDYLSLAEVQVYETAGNLALGRGLYTSQATMLPNCAVPPGNCAAPLAVDGNLDGNFWHGTVTHTDYLANPWWQVDLGSVMPLGSVNVWNRTDAYSERLTDYYVFVSPNSFSTSDTPATLLGRSDVCSYHFPRKGYVPFTNVLVNCTGRYVRVQLAGAGFLSLTEVEVLAP
jgi:hypothetical protein